MSQAETSIDLDAQCGVTLPNGNHCTHSLRCKAHSRNAKRAVVGRSKTWDVLASQKKRQEIQEQEEREGREGSSSCDDGERKGHLRAYPSASASVSHLMRPLNLDTQCGVELPRGNHCHRSLTCRLHSLHAKRAVAGRLVTWDALVKVAEVKRWGAGRRAREKRENKQRKEKEMEVRRKIMRAKEESSRVPTLAPSGEEGASPVNTVDSIITEDSVPTAAS